MRKEQLTTNTANRICNNRIFCLAKNPVSVVSCQLSAKRGQLSVVSCPRTRGVSLLELLIYISILSGLMVVVSDAFISLSKGRGQSEARSEVNSAIRFASDLIKQDVKNASAVSAPLVGTPSSALTLTVGADTILYDMAGGVLHRSVNDTPEPVTGDLVAVDIPIFTRLENYNAVLNATTTAIQVVMTMRYNASSADWTYSDTLRTTITLR